jgi:transcriptional regulator with XRE-family HTH domain
MVRAKSKTEDEITDELLVAIGERVKALRTSFGWSQRKLADDIGMTASAIYLIEKGQQNSTITSLKKLSLAFGVSMGALLPEGERGAEVSEKPGRRSQKSDRVLEGLRSRCKSARDSIDEIEKMVSIYVEVDKEKK